MLPTPNKNYTVALYGPPPLLFSFMVLYWVSNTLECWPGGVVIQSHSRLRFFFHFDTGPQLDTTWNILHMFLFPPLPNILPDNSNLFKFADTFTTTGLWHPITPTQERQANASITCCAAILNIQTCYLCIQVAKRDGNESTLKKNNSNDLIFVIETDKFGLLQYAYHYAIWTCGSYVTYIQTLLQKQTKRTDNCMDT